MRAERVLYDKTLLTRQFDCRNSDLEVT